MMHSANVSSKEGAHDVGNTSVDVSERVSKGLEER